MGRADGPTGHLEQHKQVQVTAQQFGENHQSLMEHDCEAFIQYNTQVQSMQNR